MGSIQINIQFQKKQILMASFVWSILTNTWSTGQIDQFGREKERSYNLGLMKVVEAFKHNRSFSRWASGFPQCG
jgi:hypothetical protein